MEKQQYAVIRDTSYYQGDCQHPRGWTVEIETIHPQEEICIGTLKECEGWKEELESERCTFCHNEAGYTYKIVKVIESNIDYQHWLDAYVDWDGCPSEDGSDYDANCDWAENQAYENDGTLFVFGYPYDYIGHVIDLSDINTIEEK